jgi:hypothetical protein
MQLGWFSERAFSRIVENSQAKFSQQKFTIFSQSMTFDSLGFVECKVVLVRFFIWLNFCSVFLNGRKKNGYGNFEKDIASALANKVKRTGKNQRKSSYTYIEKKWNRKYFWWFWSENSKKNLSI